jgi:hypothetical protein
LQDRSASTDFFQRLYQQNPSCALIFNTTLISVAARVLFPFFWILLERDRQNKDLLKCPYTHRILVIDPETDKALKLLDVGADPHAHAVYTPKE